MKRRAFLRSIASSVLALSAKNSLATYQDCNTSGCAVGISTNEFAPHARYQKDTNLCWAAVIESIFSWYGYELEQTEIVQQVFGVAVNVPSGPGLPFYLNRSYITSDGQAVSIKSKLHVPEAGITQISNYDIIQALQSGKPCVFCNMTHMMTLIGISYQNLFGNQINVVQARLMDPFYPGKFRNALPTELANVPVGILRFMAIPTLSV